MSEIILMSDSSCDLSNTLIKKYDIHLVPFYISFDTQTYYKENIDITIDELYRQLRSENIFPKTSLPSINDYYEKFLSIVVAQKSIICVCLSSIFSGS